MLVAQLVSVAALARQRIAMIQRLRRRGAGRLRLRRARPNRVAREPGNQRVVARTVVLRGCASGGLNIMRASPPVLTVRWSVTGPLPAEIVRLGGAKRQDTCAGSVPQEKLMVPMYPPVGVMVMTSCPELPG